MIFPTKEKSKMKGTENTSQVSQSSFHEKSCCLQSAANKIVKDTELKILNSHIKMHLFYLDSII